MEVVEVERNGVEYGQDEEIRQAEQDGQPHHGAGGTFQRTAPLQGEIDAGQAETEHDHGDNHVGHIGVPDNIEHADQGQFHHQGGHGDQQQAKGKATHNKTPGIVVQTVIDPGRSAQMVVKKVECRVVRCSTRKGWPLLRSDRCC